MSRSTLIRKLTQKKYILKYILLNILTIFFMLLIIKGPANFSGLILVLVTMFVPMALFVYEAIITVGRLHDADRSVNFVLLLYFKFELVKRLFYEQYDLLLAISLIVYIGFISFLMTQKSKNN